MMNLKLRLKLRCPKHRSFKPEHGRGAVKAGCQACQDLCSIYALAQQVVERVMYFERDYPAHQGNGAEKSKTMAKPCAL